MSISRIFWKEWQSFHQRKLKTKSTNFRIYGKTLTEKMMKKADIIVVMHPSIARNIPLKYLEKLKVWRIDSLLGKSKDDVVIIRDRIKEMVKHLINEMKG